VATDDDPLAIRTEVVVSVHALGAAHTCAGVPADTDAVTDLSIGHLVPHGRDDALAARLWEVTEEIVTGL
jgi:hypothetical protein